MRNPIPEQAEFLLDEYDAERFWTHVNRHGGTPYADDPLATATGECWLWSEATDKKHYGRFRLHGGWTQAHRVSYRDFGHNLPDELKLDHLCRITQCVNPAHLEPVTQLENVRRGLRGQITECVHGHEYTPENTIRRGKNGDNSRECRTCLAASKRRTYLRRKNAA